MTIVMAACAACGLAGLHLEWGPPADPACNRDCCQACHTLVTFSLHKVCPSNAMPAMLSIAAIICTFGLVPLHHFLSRGPAAQVQELTPNQPGHN